MAFDSIVGYTYQADIYCPKCILSQLHIVEPLADVEVMLDRAAEMRNIDRNDESTFDTDDFPKVILSVSNEGERCGQCHELLEGDEPLISARVTATTDGGPVAAKQLLSALEEVVAKHNAELIDSDTEEVP